MKNICFFRLLFLLIACITPYSLNFSQEEPYFSEEEVAEKIDPCLLERSKFRVENWYKKNNACVISQKDISTNLVFIRPLQSSVDFSINGQGGVVKRIYIPQTFLENYTYVERTNFDNKDECRCFLSILSWCRAGFRD